ncbi:LacI family DNA-binding transcriptional regulator [Paenibacillus qinlingensis]|uniref:LacI family transcriptional regulator n=1 Tax=Paenibacillus qinlingensis TaxID=1837343 RepID=A0ABU1NNT4_9BACL|nr:LacI family DNA-binding transcriptional regulator [Paenibacillus qinlingensis]MDR6549120.1 LacI family transcriptional regulator [Paenibacillus qinlingensis]
MSKKEAAMVTLKDIAAKTNLSVTTVSRVVNFNDTTICSEDTQRLIWSLVESMNYKVKNKRAKVSKEADPQRAYKLGYVLGQSSYAAQGSYGYHIIKGIESEAINRGSSITFSCLNLDLYKPAELCERFEEAGVHAVIWIAGTDEAYLNMLKSKNFRVTVVGIEPSFLPEHVDYVGVDFYPETLKWLKTKFVNRFEQMGYIGPLFSSRYEAFIDAHKILGKPIDPSFVIEHEGWEVSSAKAAMAEFLERTERLPEAFFAASDLIAIGSMTTFKEKGVLVPDQVKILGFDNNEMAGYVSPGLTTIGVPTYEIGVVAVQASISRLNEERDFPVRFILPTRYVERESL